MSAKVKKIIAAILAFIVAAFGWYMAYSDGIDTTKPDTDKVIEAGKEIINIATEKEAVSETK